MTTKIFEETEKKIRDHDKYITTNDFNKFSGTIFDGKLKYAKLPTKADLAKFIKKRYFDEKLKNINKKVTANSNWHFLLIE